MVQINGIRLYLMTKNSGDFIQPNNKENNWKMWLCTSQSVKSKARYHKNQQNKDQPLIASHTKEPSSWHLPDISDICHHCWRCCHTPCSKCACTAAADNLVVLHIHYKRLMTSPQRSVPTYLTTSQNIEYILTAYCAHYLSLADNARQRASTAHSWHCGTRQQWWATN